MSDVQYVKIETEVPKEVHELAKALYKITESAKVATDDGWQTGTDLPLVLGTAASELLVAMQGVEKLGEEAKEAPALFSKALALAGADIASLWVRKEPEA